MAEIEGSRRDTSKVKPREKPKKLVEVQGEFPEKLPKKIASIIDRFAPFEDLALEAGDNPIDGLDLNDLMQAEGTLNDEIVRSIESAAKTIRAYLNTQERQMIKIDVRVEGGMEHHTANAASIARFERLHQRIGASFTKILRAIAADRRPVASRFVMEIAQYSLLLSMSEGAAAEGIQSAVDQQRRQEATMEASQRALFDVIVAASYYEARGTAAKYPHSAKDAFELLRDGAYLPTSEQGIPVTLEGIVFEGLPVHAVIKTAVEQNPLIIGVIELHNPLVKQPLVRLLLSRLTGELVPDGMQVVSAEPVFTMRGKGEVYNRIRATAFGAFLAAVENGDIKEQPFMSFNEEEQKEILRYRVPKTQSGTTTPNEQAAPSEQEDEEELEDEEPEPPQQPPLENKPERSIQQQIDEMNKPSKRSKKEKRVIWYTSRISWRRVMKTLERLGVKIENFDHPKLTFGKETAGYLNSHDTDTEHNKRVLFATLDALKIHPDTFFAKLK